MFLRVECRLERGEAKTAIGLQKRLGRVAAQIEVGHDNAFDRRNDLICRKTRACAFTDLGILGPITTQRDLVVFYARAVEAQNADVANMVVPASVDAARDFNLQWPDFVLKFEGVKVGRDLLRDGDRTRGGQQ